MARLPQGVRKRKDGLLEKRFTVEGKRYSIYASSIKELSNKEIELRELIRSKCYIGNKNITLDKYFAEWLKRKKKTNKSNSIYTYQNIYNTHIKNALGDRKVSQIEKREILAFYEGLAEKTAPSTCNYIMGLLKQLFVGAVEDDIIIPVNISNQ